MGTDSWEKAQALIEKGGYRYLDVRPKVEYEDIGRVIPSLNIPKMNGQKKWSAKKKRKVSFALYS